MASTIFCFSLAQFSFISLNMKPLRPILAHFWNLLTTYIWGVYIGLNNSCIIMNFLQILHMYVIGKIDSKIVNRKSMIDIFHEDFCLFSRMIREMSIMTSNFFPKLTKTTSFSKFMTPISSLNWWNPYPILNSVKFQIFNVYSL